MTLNTTQVPSHSHSASTTVSATADLKAKGSPGDTTSPTGNVLAVRNRSNNYSTAAPDVSMSSDAIDVTASASTTVGNTGGSQPVNIRNPHLGLRYCFALQGLFPPRN